MIDLNSIMKESNYYLSINRLVPNKRIDLLIKSFNKLQKPLFIIGDDLKEKNYKKLLNLI